MNQFLVPYLMSSHPGSTLDDAIDLALYLKKHKIRPEQVQDFYPTPGTAATTMYYTGLDPFTMQPVKVTRDYEEKRMQRALLQSTRPENAELVRKAILLSGREDAWQLLGHRPEARDKGANAKPGGAKAYGRKDKSGKTDRNGKTDRSGSKSGSAPFAKPGKQGTQGKTHRPREKRLCREKHFQQREALSCPYRRSSPSVMMFRSRNRSEMHQRPASPTST